MEIAEGKWQPHCNSIHNYKKAFSFSGRLELAKLSPISKILFNLDFLKGLGHQIEFKCFGKNGYVLVLL
jgi:hypothetical protein